MGYVWCLASGLFGRIAAHRYTEPPGGEAVVWQPLRKGDHIHFRAVEAQRECRGVCIAYVLEGTGEGAAQTKCTSPDVDELSTPRFPTEHATAVPPLHHQIYHH